MSNILNALAKLDPNNDNHWTDDGLPRMDTVKMLTGNPGLTRDAVTVAAPGFDREQARAAAPVAADSGTPGAWVAVAPPAPPVAPAVAPAVQESAPPAPPAPPESDLPQLQPTPLAEEVQSNEDLESKMAELKLQLSDRIDFLAKTKEEIAEIENEMARLQGQLSGNGSTSNGNDLTGYFAQQKKTLEERAARKAAIAGSGVNLKELLSGLRSPLDASKDRRRLK